eukprot:TRINITY_DN1339_c0_g1_i1.p1 TRINITY_DN1339_c0_g1~~TRINITY_DN1339_c0_g1_i1.p1  ORF type:complete len:429 (-),score=104.38 TRINITY_DN1339_c0_g1_i1:16-1236(-)
MDPLTGNKRKLTEETQNQAQAKQPKVEKSEHSSLKIQTFPEQYNQMLDEKVARVKGLFNDLPDFPASDVEVFESTKENFRMRTGFCVKHYGGRMYYVMFDQKTPVEVTSFPMGSKLINDLMPKILEECSKHEVLSFKLFEVRFHTTLSGEALVVLIYHKNLDDAWKVLAEELSKTLNIKIIGRSRKGKVCIPEDKNEDFVTEVLNVNGKVLKYKQIEGSFSQPNSEICSKMLEWALKVTAPPSTDADLLELYCGNGNFTIALAPNFRNVLATEISSSGVAACKYNIALNGVENIKVARLSAEEFTEAWSGSREFKRLVAENIKKEDYNIQTIFVDPPRAGLDDLTRKLSAEFDNIVYISCNPETLHRDLLEITKTHKIMKFAVFDQFPYTDHLECGAYLTRKSTNE